MRQCGTILCAVPASAFSTEASSVLPVELLRAFLIDLTAVERRLRKGVVMDDERLRHARLCRRIEEIALGNAQFAPTRWAFGRALRGGNFPSLRVGSGYLELIDTAYRNRDPLGSDAAGRLGASVLAPRELAAHLEVFASTARALSFEHDPAVRHRLWFLRKRVLPTGCGLVEVPDPLGASPADEQAAREAAADGRSLWERLLSWLKRGSPAATPMRLAASASPPPPATEPGDWVHYGQADRGRFMKGRLRVQIDEALAGGVPIDLGNQRHNMATELLAERIHRGAGQPPARVAVVYGHGHDALPFPLHCLDPLPDGWSPTRELHVGLVSMRHLPIDQYIDINWYRNVEMSSTNGMAAADEAAFRTSMEHLAALLRANRGQRLRLYVYHTGFVPAVIGFYRALVTTLASAECPKGCLQVVPRLQPTADGYTEGAAWPR